MTAVDGKSHRAHDRVSPRDIFHITTEEDWARAQAEGAYSASTSGLTLAQVGFVHCAYEEQVARVADVFFPGLANLRVLRIVIYKLDSEMQIENITHGDE